MICFENYINVEIVAILLNNQKARIKITYQKKKNILRGEKNVPLRENFVARKKKNVQTKIDIEIIDQKPKNCLREAKKPPTCSQNLSKTLPKPIQNR